MSMFSFIKEAGEKAALCCGNVGNYPVIFEANRSMLSHPDKIYPGHKLRIPALAD